MADDIVKRLRHIHMEVNDLQDVAEDAADEIERLRTGHSALHNYTKIEVFQQREARRG